MSHPRGNSTVDYTVASVGLLEHFEAFQVEEISIHSHHCPLSFKLTTDPGSIFQLMQLHCQLGDLLPNYLIDKILKKQKCNSPHKLTSKFTLDQYKKKK